MLTVTNELLPQIRDCDNSTKYSHCYAQLTTSRTLQESATSSDDPVSRGLKEIFRVVVYVSVCGLLSVFGIGANVVNIVVFVRQGFKDSINISLLGLAVADFGCAVTMFWMSAGFNPLLDDSDLTFNLIDVVCLTGGWPHVYFNRITSLITTFITLERCLCVTFPLKVKGFITPFRTKLIIISIFIVMLTLCFPVYFANKLEWVYDSRWNKTVLSLVYTEYRVAIETTTFAIHSILLPAISLMTVITSTIILTVELNQKQKWRQKSTAQHKSKSESPSVKEKKVVKMVALMSVIFIICYTPATINFFLISYNPDFGWTGKYANVYFIVWTFTAFIQTVSFSVNIFVYFNMSSKFKATILQMLSRGIKVQ